jgi:ribonuclease M5
MEKIKISQGVIVEGKYDKIKLENIIDAFILETNGFGIFKDKKSFPS